MGNCGLDSSGSPEEPVWSCDEHGKGPSDFIQCGEILD